MSQRDLRRPSPGRPVRPCLRNSRSVPASAYPEAAPPVLFGFRYKPRTRPASPASQRKAHSPVSVCILSPGTRSAGPSEERARSHGKMPPAGPSIASTPQWCEIPRPDALDIGRLLMGCRRSCMVPCGDHAASRVVIRLGDWLMAGLSPTGRDQQQRTKPSLSTALHGNSGARS